MHISIVDIGINNSRSIEKAFIDQLQGDDTLSISEKPDAGFKASDLIVIPGVGNFGVAIDNLMDSGFFEQIKEASQMGKKIVGVCLGMQLLFESSDESPSAKGLELIAGSCRKISTSITNRVPHIGWNEVSRIQPDSKFSSLNENKDFYFVHSYHAEPADQQNILTLTRLERGEIVSSVLNQNILGFQFHPEKSGTVGRKLLREVLNWARDED